MAGLTRATVVKKVKKHGKKKFVRVSNKKAVKNGRYQEKEMPVPKTIVKVKPVKKIKPVVADSVEPVEEETFENYPLIDDEAETETDDDSLEYEDGLATGD